MGVGWMNIIESDKYKNAYKKLLKRRTKDKERIENIKNLLISKNTLHDVMVDPLHIIYHIEQLSHNRHEYSARINNSNNKMRIIMIPIGDYPYKTMEITDIIFDDIDNYHYERG